MILEEEPMVYIVNLAIAEGVHKKQPFRKMYICLVNFLTM